MKLVVTLLIVCQKGNFGLKLLGMLDHYQCSSKICVIIYYPNVNELSFSLVLPVSPYLVKF